MASTEKLIAKLKNGSINAKELRTLLKQVGAEHVRTKGSHEIYHLPGRVFVLATHSKDLKRYMIKEAMEFIGVENE
ncbi:MAG: type II toxin-antitoxin system HicA family toxin [Anaerolineaceae bacterium]|nr:MAG: type II toxin-antitoxin system HicA family toxin [Anaerolineaceae bacterium]